MFVKCKKESKFDLNWKNGTKKKVKQESIYDNVCVFMRLNHKYINKICYQS